MKHVRIHLVVNGEDYSLFITPNRVLLDVLREDLELTGTKEGADLENAAPARYCWMAVLSTHV